MVWLALVSFVVALGAAALAFVCWRELGRSHEREVVLYDALERVTQAAHGTPDGSMIRAVRDAIDDAWHDVHRLGEAVDVRRLD